MDNESPYFIVEHKEINSVSDIIDLTKKKVFSSPGIEFNYEVGQSNSKSDSEIFNQPYKTCGLFRGQSENWPLIPSSYRNIKKGSKPSPYGMDKAYLYISSNKQLIKFCDLAKKQNQEFPKSILQQMFIGQHYGIDTPLLDWTTNIFVAIYFALDLRDEKDEKKNLEPFIYHLKDERLLKSDFDEENIIDINYSAIVNPLPLDRRIERQFSVFSFHPHPNFEPIKVPVVEYKINGNLFCELWHIMDGLGFSSPHFFPDYAGLANRIKLGL